MEPTNLDLYYATIYARERSKLRFLNFLMKKHPNIASHLLINVKKATLDDYYYSKAFENYAIKVDIKLGKTACDQINCIPWNNKGPCKPETKPSYFKISEQDYGVSCGFSCYNLKKSKEIGVPMTKYINNKCIMVPTTDVWMHFPISRDSARFTRRLNDFGEGFHQRLDETSPLDYSFSYTPSYCARFLTEFNSETLNCEEPTRWFFLDAIIGKSFLATIGELIEKGTKTEQEPGPDVPYYSIDLNKWKSFVDKKRIPPPNILVSDLCYYSFDHFSVNTKTKIENLKSNILGVPDLDNQTRRIIEATCPMPKNVNTKISYESIVALLTAILGTAYGAFTDQLAEIIFGMIGDPKTWIGFSDTLVFGIIKLVSRSLAKYLSVLAGTSKVFFKKIFLHSIQSVFMTTATKLIFTSMSKLMLNIYKTVSAIDSVVGIVLVFITLFDLIFTFWDPFGFNRQFPPGYLKNIGDAFTRAFIIDVGTSDLEFSFDILCYFLCTKEEMLELSILQIEDVYEYLTSLSVNSNGSVIDKGPKISLNDKEKDRGDDMINNLNFKMEIDQVRLYNYEIDHKTRINTIGFCGFCGLLFLIFGLLLSIVNSLLALILIIIGIILGTLGYFYLTTEELPLNLFDETEIELLNEIKKLFNKYIEFWFL